MQHHNFLNFLQAFEFNLLFLNILFNKIIFKLKFVSIDINKAEMKTLKNIRLLNLISIY